LRLSTFNKVYDDDDDDDDENLKKIMINKNDQLKQLRTRIAKFAVFSLITTKLLPCITKWFQNPQRLFSIFYLFICMFSSVASSAVVGSS